MADLWPRVPVAFIAFLGPLSQIYIVRVIVLRGVINLIRYAAELFVLTTQCCLFLLWRADKGWAHKFLISTPQLFDHIGCWAH